MRNPRAVLREVSIRETRRDCCMRDFSMESIQGLPGRGETLKYPGLVVDG
jgi:hypothetical protein